MFQEVIALPAHLVNTSVHNLVLVLDVLPTHTALATTVSLAHQAHIPLVPHLTALSVFQDGLELPQPLVDALNVH